jgi:hypothetical protein
LAQRLSLLVESLEVIIGKIGYRSLIMEDLLEKSESAALGHLMLGMEISMRMEQTLLIRDTLSLDTLLLDIPHREAIPLTLLLDTLLLDTLLLDIPLLDIPLLDILLPGTLLNQVIPLLDILLSQAILLRVTHLLDILTLGILPNNKS